MNNSQPDFIVIAESAESPQVSKETWSLAIEQIVQRLGGPRVSLMDFYDNSPSNLPRPSDIAPNSIARLIVIPFSLEQPPLHDVRSSLWFDGYPPHLPIFIAHPLAPKELGGWIRQACIETGSDVELNLVPQRNASPENLDRLAAVAYWIGKQGLNSLRSSRDASQPDSQYPVQAYIAFSRLPYPSRDGASVRGSVLNRDREFLPWQWLSADAVATWVIGRYLDALNTHPIHVTDSDESTLILIALKKLADREYAVLPQEYMGKLDSVRSSSMGSAPIVFDEQGLVPWDRLWTSFCDLAMAGGPPHRGSLLCNVPSEEITAQMADYQKVVAELRRGIQLATGLSTCESACLGWVGVQCHSENMASWMLRAIIVENILVRREGNILYLPAGPKFRIAKEIKNVITAVAKTSHYWLAHLKTRHPPNPL
jgi:hypothetical protein